MDHASIYIYAIQEIKNGQVTSIAPLQPFILASFRTWGGSKGAGRGRLARTKITIFCVSPIFYSQADEYSHEVRSFSAKFNCFFLCATFRIPNKSNDLIKIFLDFWPMVVGLTHLPIFAEWETAFRFHSVWALGEDWRHSLIFFFFGLRPTVL